jgi:hypothetical protein
VFAGMIDACLGTPAEFCERLGGHSGSPFAIRAAQLQTGLSHCQVSLALNRSLPSGGGWGRNLRHEPA